MSENTDIKKMLLIRTKIADFYNFAISQAAKKCGISKEEADVILFFYNNPDLNLESDAVRFRGFSEEFTRNTVDLLASNGLVTALENGESRKIEIIGRGRIVGKSISEIQKRAFTSLFKNISEEDLANLERILFAIVKNTDCI